VRALAFDLDRTLIGEDVVLRPRTRAALLAAREAGLRLVVVTGRMFQATRPYLAAAGLDGLVVCYQGAVVADIATGEFLRHVPIPLELAQEAIAAVEDEGFPLNCYVGDELYVARRTPESETYASFQDIAIHEVGDLRSWLAEPPTKLVVVGERHLLDDLAVRMRERFGERLFIAKSLPFFLEFAHPSVSKGSGLAFAAERLGFAPGATVAFGDGENDLELLEWAGYGVAVANAAERLRAVADFVCPSVEDEGVAQVIEALLSVESAA
jgi:Cof subfamily protein (haloacid dehalogenase superfamily)